MKKLPTNIKKHYLEFGTYTYPGIYKDELKHLPDGVRELGLLVRSNFIHRTTLEAGNVGTNRDLRFGDMAKVPWWRQPEDDVLVTAGAMLAELYRRDKKGLFPGRKPQDKLVLTCRFVAIMMASILKSKGVPARVRAGQVPYFDMGDLGDVSTDHWINQYWDDHANRWITIDVDGSLSHEGDFDPYDMPVAEFDFPARAWLDVRSNRVDPNYFYNAGGFRGAIVILWSLFYDLHSLMNSEIIYMHHPLILGHKKFDQLKKDDLAKIDHLAGLMQNPDDNFEKLVKIWENERDLRLLSGSLL